MVNDYEPTRDPNIDTFKVQYLLGGSAVLAILFPHDYRISEVKISTLMVFFFFFFSLSHFIADSLDVLHMAWICCHSATAIHAPANRRSRYDNNTLFVCIGIISSTLHSELDLSLFRGRLFPTSFCCCWNNSDHAIFGFLLHLLHQVSGCANAHWTLGYLLTTLFFLFTGLWKARGSNSLCRAF